MNRRCVIASAAVVATGGSAGCSGIMADGGSAGGTDDAVQLDDDGPKPDSEVDQEALSDLRAFYNAWLDTDGETMLELLHDPRILWSDTEFLETLPETDFDAVIESLNPTLLDESVTAATLQTIDDDRSDEDRLADAEREAILDTPTRKYHVAPAVDGELEPTTEDERMILDSFVSAIYTPTNVVLSQQDDRWRLVS